MPRYVPEDSLKSPRFTGPSTLPRPGGGREGAMPRSVREASLRSPRFRGPSTFARLPHVRTLAEVDLAVVGVPFDTGVTYRAGGRLGPHAVPAPRGMRRPH